MSSLFICLFIVSCFFAGGIIEFLRIGLIRQRPRQPRDGIWRSARYSMLYGLIIGGSVGSIAFIITQLLQFGLKTTPWFAIAIGITSGLNVWLFCSLYNGVYILIQYYVLCSYLKKTGITAKKLPIILDIAVQCRLLSCINNSFRFSHRGLFNYFLSYPHE